MLTMTGAAVLLLALGACSSDKKSGAGSSTASTSPGASAPAQNVSGTFAAYAGPSTVAVTYKGSQVPVGATAKVTISVIDSKTQVSLHVDGLQPKRPYGAHVHNKICGAKPADAGSHYQNTKDPKQPSTNPEFANANNEVWLDFTTDDKGAADVSAAVPWMFRSGAQGPHSVVIHATHTMTTSGHAGTAGARLACITIAS
jgi:Cu-Zn family superoxide dismutase